MTSAFLPLRKDGRNALEHFKDSYSNIKKSDFDGATNLTYDDALSVIHKIEEFLINMQK